MNLFYDGIVPGDGTPGPAREAAPRADPDEAVAGKFARLSAAFYAETSCVSVPRQRYSNPAYQSIIGMGPVVVPLLIADLPHDWFYALHCITEADPVKPEDRGNIRAMSDSWRAWYARCQGTK